MSDSEWVSAAALAAEFGVPIGTVYGWNYKGTGPRFASIGRHVRYRRADIEAWVKTQYADPVPAA